MSDNIDKLKELVKIQSSKGCYDVNEYMRGMANGLICALSVFTNEDPIYHKPLNQPAEQKCTCYGKDNSISTGCVIHDKPAELLVSDHAYQCGYEAGKNEPRLAPLKELPPDFYREKFVDNAIEIMHKYKLYNDAAHKLFDYIRAMFDERFAQSNLSSGGAKEVKVSEITEFLEKYFRMVEGISVCEGDKEYEHYVDFEDLATAILNFLNARGK